MAGVSGDDCLCIRSVKVLNTVGHLMPHAADRPPKSLRLHGVSAHMKTHAEYRTACCSYS